MIKFLGIYKSIVKSVVSPGGQDKGVCHFKIRGKKKKYPFPVPTLTQTLTVTLSPISFTPRATSEEHAHNSA